MGHFPAYIIVPKHTENILQAVEDLLAPYQENNLGTCRKEYLEFWDRDDEFRKDYEQDSREMVRLGESGPLEELHGNLKFRNPQYDCFNPKEGSPYLLPAGYIKVMIPLKQLYPTFAGYMDGCERNPKTGRYGHWENPHARWDGWMIGGRATGMLDPAFGSDPANLETCRLCKGSGRMKVAKKKQLFECMGCEGKGKRLKGALTQTGHDCDIAPIEKLLSMDKAEFEFPAALVTPEAQWIEPEGGVWSLGRIDDDVALKNQWLSKVRETLEQYKEFLAVVVDCHM